MNAAKAERTAATVLTHVVAGDFEGLLEISPESRVTAAGLRGAVSEYGRRLVSPPVPIGELLDIVSVSGSKPLCWSVDLPLWTQEEGRSDLTLQMHFTESEGDTYRVEIDDLHVL